MTPLEVLYGYYPPIVPVILLEQIAMGSLQDFLTRRQQLDQILKGKLEVAKNIMK